MEYLKNKILILLFFLPLVSYGQWSYTFTDPCTLNQQTIQVAGNNSVALNYFGNVQTFSEDDFSNGVFDSWLDLVTQANTSNPCESVTQVITNTTNSVVVQNTLTVVTNIMSILGGDMLPQAVSSSAAPVAEAIDNSAGEDEKEDNNNNSEPNNNSESGNNKEGESGNNKEKNEDEEAEGVATISLANSISNSVDGGSAEANKNAGSLIASGDIVVIDNRDNSNGRQVKVVGSITHANTEQTRIKGALFTYTSVTNDFSLTLYKSWINPNRTFNLVGANTTVTDWKKNHLNTTTVLESFKFGKNKFTGMAGLNLTIGKLGKRDLQNISAVAGVHRNFKISEKITTSTLLLGVYSPFTQYYEGKWWDPGVLIVPFSSWDIKITKTFKYNISFTGVWQSGGSALNFQILTGGKIRF
ncbi:MAG: hypothetical protein GY817_08615 [bacterium]|nr:hypothetical protein [bacterium]